MIDNETMAIVVADQISQNGNFDYSQLDPDVLDAVIDQENLLEDVLKRSRVEIGNILIRVKEILPHGTFMDWYLSKGITSSSCSRCIQEAKVPNLGNLPKQKTKSGNPNWRRDADGNWHTEPVSRYMYGKSIVLTRGTGDKKELIRMEYGAVESPHVIAWIDDDQLDDIMRCGAILKSE